MFLYLILYLLFAYYAVYITPALYLKFTLPAEPNTAIRLKSRKLILDFLPVRLSRLLGFIFTEFVVFRVFY